ncbi:MAG: ATPase [Gemmataceae bacterium]|nr:ATPase [Gemmataceae bacterium]
MSLAPGNALKADEGLLTPPSPDTLKETGLSLGELSGLILKFLYTRGSMLGLDLSRGICLPFKIIEEGLAFLKSDKCLDVVGGDLIGRVSYKFQLTDLGRTRAQETMKVCGYVGPAPVPLAEYVKQTYKQAVTNLPIDQDALRESFAHLVVSEDLFLAVGPAILSGKSIFIYGPPGTGKTSIASSIGDFMNKKGGDIFVPYAFTFEGNIITIYDPAIHVLAADPVEETPKNEQDAAIRRLLNANAYDPRWVRIRRPVVITGGELSLAMLEPRYSPETNYYQGPLHVKANGGIFLVDDFGRQLCSPKELLNRWIVPLESRVDFLNLASGQKFMVPFEQLTIFSTNMDPKGLVDDAFLRRMRHKLEIGAPKRDIYEKIFKSYCKKQKMEFCPEAVDYLFEQFYNRGRTVRASDCRDLLETVSSICRFRSIPVHLTRELMVEAAKSFIGEFV